MNDLTSLDSEQRLKKAADDFERYTLKSIEGEVAKLVYLASARDYNTGVYRHDGLAFDFTEDGSHRILEAAHRAAFSHVASLPLEELTSALEQYFHAAGDALELARVWKELRPYHITIPQGQNPLKVSLFIANIKIAVEILYLKWKLEQAGRI